MCYKSRCSFSETLAPVFSEIRVLELEKFTLIRRETDLFKSALQTGGILKTPILCFSVDGKRFKTELVENCYITIIMSFLFQSFPQTLIKNHR